MEFLLAQKYAIFIGAKLYGIFISIKIYVMFVDVAQIAEHFIKEIQVRFLSSTHVCLASWPVSHK